MIDPPIAFVYIAGQENEPLPEYTAEQIRELRESLGESQTEFGKRLGYTQVHVSYLETGKKKPTKVLMLALETIAREAKEKS